MLFYLHRGWSSGMLVQLVCGNLIKKCDKQSIFTFWRKWGHFLVVQLSQKTLSKSFKYLMVSSAKMGHEKEDTKWQIDILLELVSWRKS